MTAPVYVFIATKTTYETVIPKRTATDAEFRRQVSNAFAGNVGGQIFAGDLRMRPINDSIANHLLCDGSLFEIRDFPQLFDVLGNDFGGDGASTFAVPNYSNDILAMPPSTITQTVDAGGTITTNNPAVPEPVAPTEPGQTGGTTGANVVSGGRPRLIDDQENDFR